ncbi:hypothetical protein RRG08_036159 [Elysia crispata]|uniref:Uncharacterized protein n=1 Tax=Elysia crispata TaxID=231223 RepID=A0AAE0XE14_9GAST|nr:hypothetical protein RRG08_036159 [Elysia crispata]
MSMTGIFGKAPVLKGLQVLFCYSFDGSGLTLEVKVGRWEIVAREGKGEETLRLREGERTAEIIPNQPGFSLAITHLSAGHVPPPYSGQRETRHASWPLTTVAGFSCW